MTHDKFCEYDGEITSPCGQCATIAAARADEREQAAQRIALLEPFNTFWLTQAEAVDAAVRGDVADKTGESTGGHGGLVSRALFAPSSTATVHNINNPDAVVNVRNAAVVNITQTQNVNVWTDAAARGGEQE